MVQLLRGAGKQQRENDIKWYDEEWEYVIIIYLDVGSPVGRDEGSPVGRNEGCIVASLSFNAMNGSRFRSLVDDFLDNSLLGTSLMDTTPLEKGLFVDEG